MRERLADPVAPFAYPDGYQPSWWVCDECRSLWHDAWQDDPDIAAWSVDAECGRGLHEPMTRVTPERAAVLYRAGYRAPGRRIRVALHPTTDAQEDPDA